VVEVSLRSWQHDALAEWRRHGRRGIVSVVTGGGKTIFALACMADARAETPLVVVPTVSLLDQWWEEAAHFFGIRLDEVNIVTGRRGLRSGTVNIAVLNTAARLVNEGRGRRVMLVVDECHKAASAKLRTVLDIPAMATVGLSATPERPYDDGLADVLEPKLGPIIFRYSYADALADGVIVPFALRNIVFDLEPERQAEYDKLTRAIAASINRNGIEAEPTLGLLLKRARVLNLSLNRIRLALRIAAAHRGQRILVFHEDIAACDLICQVMVENGVRAGTYHSRLSLRERAAVLASYRRGDIDALVTCRALDEGFNVPETEIGIVAASTATYRQRVQRLGRMLRPTVDKTEATIYTLVATEPEIARLHQEESDLDGVASVSWSRA